MNSSYEDIRRKTIEENQKKMQALNLTKLSQSLYKSSSSSSKPSSSVKGRPRFVQPGELEVNKKRLRSTTTQKSSIAFLPIQTTITPTPIQTTIIPLPIQTTIEDVVVEEEAENVVVGDDTENVVVGDETEDVVVEDEAEDIVRVTSSEYWDVNVINEEGYVSNTRLCVKDLVAKSEPGGT
ncbi:unnamed protein product [Lathyrus oleraceus]|uniref:Uncharacterized protein n=1 Tax=Pisum sativum TaxID=3888 RepID=A0A9D4WBR9_PEA|nr:hypothetical protein KIW84_064458 [Pisum sativum]